MSQNQELKRITITRLGHRIEENFDPNERKWGRALKGEALGLRPGIYHLWEAQPLTNPCNQRGNILDISSTDLFLIHASSLFKVPCDNATLNKRFKVGDAVIVRWDDNDFSIKGVRKTRETASLRKMHRLQEETKRLSR